MNIRHEMKKNHKWSGPQEEEVFNANYTAYILITN